MPVRGQKPHVWRACLRHHRCYALQWGEDDEAEGGAVRRTARNESERSAAGVLLENVCSVGSDGFLPLDDVRVLPACILNSDQVAPPQPVEPEKGRAVRRPVASDRDYSVFIRQGGPGDPADSIALQMVHRRAVRNEPPDVELGDDEHHSSGRDRPAS